MMDIDKFGILLTIAVVGSVLSIGGVTSGEYGFGSLGLDNLGLELPVEKTLTETVNIPANPYYEWCYKMGIDCS